MKEILLEKSTGMLIYLHTQPDMPRYCGS